MELPQNGVNGNGPGPPGNGLTVRELVEVYLKFGVEHMAPAGQENVRDTMKRFNADFGHRLVKDLRPLDLTGWIKDHPGWVSTWTIRRILACVKRLFNFGLDQELIEKNPFARVRHKGRTNRRRPMQDDHFQTIMRFADPSFRRLLIALKFTGARPKELAT